MRWPYLITAIILTVTIAASASFTPADAAEVDADAEIAWMSLSADEKRPEKFEAYLKDNPQDSGRRTAALAWYSRHEKDITKLKHHTRRMIRYHPSNMHIFFANCSMFYLEPEYRKEVIALLENHVNKGHGERGLYENLAWVCEQGAVPPVNDDPNDRERFLRYYGLPKGTELPTDVNTELADKAVSYFRCAIAASRGDKFYISLNSEKLIDLLINLDRLDEALATCKNALPHLDDITKPDFLVTYGRCLREKGRIEEAKKILGQVRGCDKEGFEEGPGHATAKAETLLGLIALKDSNVSAAKRYLLSSCDVQKCCHNITKGLSLRLARRLLEVGECQVVAEYCQTILQDFTPDQKETQDILRRALRTATQPHGK